MNFISKDAPLEVSLTKMKKIIDDFGYKIKLSKEKNPVKNSFSINLSFEGANNFIFSNGKGSLLNSCLASAYGEFIERLQTNLYFNDFYLEGRKFFLDQKEFNKNEDFLDDEIKKYYTMEGLEEDDFLDFNSNNFDKIVSLPFINQTTQKKVYFPTSILSNLYASNGLSTGNTQNEAKVQALCEIFERYVKLKVISEGLALPEFPKELIKTFTKISEDIKTLENRGFILKVYDASLNGKYPVTAIAFINPKNNTLFLSFGSHSILEVSIERTLTELLQGRDIDELDGFEKPSFDLEDISSNSNLESHFVDSNAKVAIQFLNKNKSFNYTPWKFEEKDSSKQFELLKNILDKEHKTIYLREYDYLGFYSCQMIVPNFSEIYPLEDLIYNNKNQGKLIRDFILNKESYDLDELLDELSGFDDSVNMGAFIGVIFKEDFSLGEFKADILIKQKEYEEAIFYLEQSNKDFNYTLAQVLRVYQENQNFDDFKDAFVDIFTKDSIEKSLNIIDGKESLISLEFADAYKNILKLFDSKINRR
ncbi:YcaO-like family protein [Aliarcobacter skirrowii]|uniref:YcaO-like family protein n=1 Tax=Aliarcobacter skirrowii TaxID=28200 RepID=UPI00082B24F0|nr:YcaO-like family protein [Aliarcobacter skirrowii]